MRHFIHYNKCEKGGMSLFYVWKLKKMIGFVCFLFGIGILSYVCWQSGKTPTLEVFGVDFEPSYIVVVDAGHGNPDGGAVSKSGVVEANLNLQIACLLRDALEDLGYTVIMTRSDENNIADPDQQTSLRSMKVSDIRNRIQIANTSQADMLISIHMNNFESNRYYGWQTFYQKQSEDSRILAVHIQEGISHQIDRENSRVALPIEQIKLLEESQIPSVIVECGFLSNEEDLRLLMTEEYQMQIVNGIIEGMEKTYQGDV